jgi:hypothetical protein
MRLPYFGWDLLPMENNSLRVGLLLDGYDNSAWIARLFQKINNAEYANISLLIVNDNHKSVGNSSLAEKLKNNYGSYTYRLIRALLERIYSLLIERNVRLPNANELVDCTALLHGIPAIRVKSRRKKWSDYFAEEDLATIESYHCDILIRCGFGILRGDILKVPKYGIWSYHHGDNFVNRGGPPGYWESMESWSETGSMLQILTEDLDNGKVLYRSYSRTDAMSIKDSRNSYYWKSLSFVTRKMEQLHRVGEAAFFDAVDYENRHPVFYSERLYTQPTNAELARLTYNKVKEKCGVLYDQYRNIDQWILLYHLNTEFSSSLWRYKKIIPPKDRFWADPHVVFKDNKYYIFFEELLYSTNKGYISVLTMDQDGNYGPPEVVLERPYHLSYPFVFEYDDEMYMIPESIANNTIELYHCVEFPTKWEFKMNLMTGVKAVDATLVEHDEKWWMFVGMVDNEGASASDELFLFSADNPLTTDWQPHPANPIVSDCKSARPAGRLFTTDGRLYRPSQDCSTLYGHGFNLSEIAVMDADNYSETLVSKALPHWEKAIVGIHTFNRVGRLHVADALYKRRR